MRSAARETAHQILEKLLLRGRGDGQYICDFGEGGMYATRHIFSQKVSASLVKLSACHEVHSSP